MTAVVSPAFFGGQVPLWAEASSDASKEDCPFVLVAPDSSVQKPLSSGRQTQITLLFTNNTPKDLQLPRKVTIAFSAEGMEPVTADAVMEDSADTLINAHEFIRARFQVKIPVGLTGIVSVQDSQKKANAVLVYTDLPETALADVSDLDTRPMNHYESIIQPYFVNFSSYKPVFFLFGVDPGAQDSSFQISFKYKPFNYEEENFIKDTLEKVYLAYTQHSFWDLKSDSAPFEDSRYMPEIFYYEDDLGLKLPFLIGSGFKIGYQHESNGRSGDDSRSTNYAYIQPSLVFKICRNLFLEVSPKVWIYVNNDNDTNGDLSDYRGYFDLETSIGDPTGLALRSHYRHGEKGGTIRLDLSYPLDQIPLFRGFLDLYLYARYHSGYSEQMLEYSQREDVFSLGFALVR